VVTCCSERLQYLTTFADVPAEAQGHVPINSNTRNYVALTGPPVSEDVWQTFPEQLKYCTTGWQPLKDLSWDL